ncbi:hypothetical protein [Thioalkalivibrio sp. ALMg11]|nr:hypothetical protein [Thioalkalivibrio sp. ALMg11]
MGEKRKRNTYDERPHQALADETPATVYRTRLGGGARIVYKCGPANLQH